MYPSVLIPEPNDQRHGSTVTRRRLLRCLLSLGVVAAAPAVLAGCGVRAGPPVASTVTAPRPASGRVRRAGILSVAYSDGQNTLLRPLGEEFARHGYVLDKNLQLEFRSAFSPGGTEEPVGESRREKLSAGAAELVARDVDVIFALDTEAAIAARDATRTIPIVVFGCPDLLQSGLVAGLARPGGNVTGVSTGSFLIAPKRLQLLSEAFPGATRFAMLQQPEHPDAAPELAVLNSAAQTLGVDPVPLDVRVRADAVPALQDAVAAGAQAVLTTSSTELMLSAIVTAAYRMKLPTMAPFQGFATDFFVGLLTYQPEYSTLLRNACDLVAQVLNGAHPDGLPVQLPDRYNFIVDLLVARKLGIVLPPALVEQADMVRS